MTTVRASLPLIVGLGLTLALGCAGSRAIPRADHMHGPLAHQFQRSPDYISETFWSRLSPEAYEPLETVPMRLSLDQDLAVREFGPPDYRREFESIEGEDVVEWLTIDHGELFQFVEGELVYQGPIRDLEHTLLRHGVPNQIFTNIATPNIERMTFVYRPVFGMAARFFSFADGHLVYEERHL